MAQTTAHLVEHVISWVPTRQWVVSVPMPLQYWMASSEECFSTGGFTLALEESQYFLRFRLTRRSLPWYTGALSSWWLSAHTPCLPYRGRASRPTRFLQELYDITSLVVPGRTCRALTRLHRGVHSWQRCGTIAFAFPIRCGEPGEPVGSACGVPPAHTGVWGDVRGAVGTGRTVLEH